MKQTVYHCLKVDERYIPKKYDLIYQADTAKEAIEFLENNGGGIYRNILHNFDCVIAPK